MSKTTSLPKLVAELLDAAENSVYWNLKRHALDAEEGRTDLHIKPGYVERLQKATKAVREAMKP